MKTTHKLFILFFLFALMSNYTAAQQDGTPTGTIQYSPFTKSFIKINAPKIALIHARVIDGTGRPTQESRTVLIENGKIGKIGATDSISIPEDYYTMDLANKTLIPGIVGTHNHLRIPQSALLYTAPKLYLAAGVTTIQTCGTGNPAEEIAIAKSIKNGEQPGPLIINSGPYFTGPNGKSNFIRFNDPQSISDTIRHWSNEGIEWLKVYRNTRPEDLIFIVKEAHKYGIKVTGHLCATTFAEAAEIGIDAIEHGFIHSYDHAAGKEDGICSGATEFRSNLAIDTEAVQKVQQILINHEVALGSTLAIFEAQAVGQADSRDLEVMAPFHIKAYQQRKKRKEELGEDWYFKKEWLEKSMQYDLQFFRMGGLLVAGLDPGLHNMPGFGDQKNFELFLQAGFTTEEAIQVMTSNGATLLGKSNIGTIEVGKQANLVVLNGDLTKNLRVIRKVDLVFKNGQGYDPARLIEAIKGNLGSANDNDMRYLGQKPPQEKPEIFAANLISLAERHEFGITFSKDGKEMLFGVDNNGTMEIHHTQLSNGVWTAPVKLFANNDFSHNDPMLSLDEDQLYFISDRPDLVTPNSKDYNIWYANRVGNSWGPPINIGTPINSLQHEYYTSFTNQGTLYFSSNSRSSDGGFDIYRSQKKNGKYLEPEKLPGTINSNAYEADVFVAPDESYLIFCAIREDGYGRGDLYISFKDQNGTWQTAVNMGPAINTNGHELCPFVSKDGQYLFYTSNQDIYWVSTQILESYRK